MKHDFVSMWIPTFDLLNQSKWLFYIEIFHFHFWFQKAVNQGFILIYRTLKHSWGFIY